VPEGSDAEGLERIFEQISRSCRRMGVIYCGGHTEVTGCVDRPVVIGQMLGEMKKSQLKPSCGAQAGDELLMTKWAAIEGTAIMAQEKETELLRHFPSEFIRRARNYLHDPGISVVREALLVSDFAGVHALHDPTEGGIATGVFEMAAASDLGVTLQHDKIPVGPETRRLCGFFEVDPLGIFASGALLMAVAPEEVGSVAAKLEAEDIPAARIGVMTPKAEGKRLIKADEAGPLPVYCQDELSRIFG
jgi:hydrogenase maturation factor